MVEIKEMRGEEKHQSLQHRKVDDKNRKWKKESLLQGMVEEKK